MINNNGNIAIGYKAMMATTTGCNNTALGFSTLNRGYVCSCGRIIYLIPHEGLFDGVGYKCRGCIAIANRQNKWNCI